MHVTGGIDVMRIGGLTTTPPQHQTTDQPSIMEMIKPRPRDGGSGNPDQRPLLHGDHQT